MNEIIDAIYSIVLSYCYQRRRNIFMPHEIHAYIYKLIEDDSIHDYWKDWVWTGLGPYSTKLGYQLHFLKQLGLIKETCITTDNGIEICGLMSIEDKRNK